MTTDKPDPITLAAAQRDAIDDVNRWRGHCLECLARVENAVADTLAAMAATKEGAAIRTPHLFGQKNEALRTALAPDGPFAAKGKPALKALDRLEPALALRNILVHATGSVWIDANDGWLWRYRFTPSGKGKTEEVGSITRAEATAMEKSLASGAQSLRSLLKAVRDKIGKQH